MNSFEQLVYEVERKGIDDLKEFFTSFFIPNNYDDYWIDENASEEEKTAIYEMFHSNEDILLRSLEICEEFPLCLESFYVNYCLNEEPIIYVHLNNIFQMRFDYQGFSEYEKRCFISIMDFFVTFLIDIHNITYAIYVLKETNKLAGISKEIYILRLSFLYSLIENKNDFYELYLNEEFTQTAPYLLLIIVLLKHQDEIKAKEVLNELLSKNKYAEYIDHIWDIRDSEDEKAIEFNEAVDACFEEIVSVPYFFTWCSENKEKVLES